MQLPLWARERRTKNWGSFLTFSHTLHILSLLSLPLNKNIGLNPIAKFTTISPYSLHDIGHYNFPSTANSARWGTSSGAKATFININMSTSKPCRCTYWRSALSLIQQLLHHGLFIKLCTSLHVDPSVLKESRFDGQCWNVTEPKQHFSIIFLKIVHGCVVTWEKYHPYRGSHLSPSFRT